MRRREFISLISGAAAGHFEQSARAVALTVCPHTQVQLSLSSFTPTFCNVPLPEVIVHCPDRVPYVQPFHLVRGRNRVAGYKRESERTGACSERCYPAPQNLEHLCLI